MKHRQGINTRKVMFASLMCKFHTGATITAATLKLNFCDGEQITLSGFDADNLLHLACLLQTATAHTTANAFSVSVTVVGTL